MAKRRRIKHNATFEERLAEEAIRCKEAAERQPPGSTARECFCGAPDRPKRHHISTIGFDLPDYSRPQH
jgi:hypothetical protein